MNAAEVGANMELEARPLTKWSPVAAPSFLSPYWMQDVLAFWSQHSLDHVEVKAIKNAEVISALPSSYLPLVLPSLTVPLSALPFLYLPLGWRGPPPPQRPPRPLAERKSNSSLDL